jgi:chromosome segregation ATPase
MSKVIAQLACTVPSDDLLAQIDIAEVYEKFHNTFKRLDDFKRARDEHERRNFFGRLFNRDELKSAQLDAQQLQAEFSKTLAQLMVISSLQAQQLTEQQVQLTDQQKTLDAKAEELAQQNIRLEQHQAEIKHQAADLRQYVTDLLKVQGLTDEHGEILISIAKEVMETRDSLLADFDNRMHQVQDALDEQQQLLREVLDEQASSLEQRLTQLQQVVDSTQEKRLQTVEQGLLTTFNEQSSEATRQIERLDANLALQAQQQEDKHRDLDRQLSELREVLAEQAQTLLNERNERQQERAEQQAELHVLRNEQSNSEIRFRREQRRLLAGLCGLALVCIGAIAGLNFWSTSKPFLAPVEIHEPQIPAP